MLAIGRRAVAAFPAVVRSDLTLRVLESAGVRVNAMADEEKSRVGLVGLAVMGQVRDPPRDGRSDRRTFRRFTPFVPIVFSSSKSSAFPLPPRAQNLALNVAEKGFKISVFNRSGDKTDNAVARAQKEGLGDKLVGYKDMKEFVNSLQKPRSVIILVKAGAPVDATIKGLSEHMEPGDIIIDGGNEWYENTERRIEEAHAKNLLYMGMGVSGGEEGARNGPSMMPGGDVEAYEAVKEVLTASTAQTDSGACVTFVGKGGAGNFVKMVHNGIEYGDMQLISEAYDVLKTVGGLTNAELATAFNEWNAAELDSFLIEISALILAKEDDQVADGGPLVDKILDKTGMKGTGKWTVQQDAELSVAIPTIASSLDARFISGVKDERVAAEACYKTAGLAAADAATPKLSAEEKKQLVDDVRAALYASKICSYAQGMNLIRAKSTEQEWGLDLGEMARIWKGGCIIRARFLDRIKKAYDKDANLPSLLVDGEFAAELVERNESWRRVVTAAINAGVATPSMSGSLAYFDSYRRGRLPANLVQAQRDFFGSHTYERTDMEGWHHTVWSDMNSADSITTDGYNA